MKKAVRKLLSCMIVFGMLVTYLVPVQANEPQSDPLQEQEDIETIKTRLKEYFLDLDTIDDGAKVETCLVSEAKEYLESMNNDGSWDDVDYTATDNAANGRPWSPYLALDRLQAIAIAYYEPSNELYQDDDVLEALNNAFSHWKGAKPKSDNWWENDIGVNLRFARIGLFLENDLSSEALNVIINNLNVDGVYHGTGQNNLWYDQNALYRALLTKDADKLRAVIDDCLSYVLVLQTTNVTAEALQVDNSLYFHGIQFYSNGYGLSMFRDVSFWLYILRGTTFAMDQEIVNRMADYMLDGTRWTIRGDIAELYLGYRPYKYDVELSNYAEEYIAPLERMIEVDPTRASEYQILLENIKGERNDNGLDGNNYMWRVGYASHMRNDYGVNIKMDSSRIIGGEWRGSWTGGNQGQLIYWTSSAVSTIMVDGDEYTNVYPTYDWAHCPGATTAARLVDDYSNYGRFTNGTAHTIGVSDGRYGSTAYVMNKKGTQATKGYFFFDDEFVALGAGISSTESVEIHTTLNQAEAKDVIVDGQNVATGTKADAYTTNWLYNGKVGYVFLEDQEVVVSNTTQADKPSLWPEEFVEDTPETFTAWLNHGTKPSNESYAYVVVPNTDAAGTESYADDIQITVVENSKAVQAVRHDGLKITQINFYEAGTLEYAPGKEVTVSEPCSIIIDENEEKPFISLATTDTDYDKEIEVELDIEGVESTTVFATYPAPYTGVTTILQAGQTNIYQASSYDLNHGPEKAYDGDLDTYWKSGVDGEQFINSTFGTSKFVSKMTIDWNDNYATKYKVQTSVDGHNYEDVTDILTGSGGQEVVDIYKIASHVRIVCLESNAGAGYEIKEVTYATGDNIALNKKATASSVSTNAPTFVPSLAVDGNSGTRWASLRNSTADWLMVDLGGEATIDAISIEWENARSSKYTIEVSDDKISWTPVEVVEAEEIAAGVYDLFDSFIFTQPVEGRYIRINSEGAVMPQYGISIYELTVYGNAEVAGIDDDLENIALGKSISASSINSTDAAEKAIDGNGGTFWKSGSQTEHWLNIALRDTYTISGVRLQWGSGYLSNYDIQVSNNGSDWTTIETVSPSIGGTDEIVFNETVDAKFIRFFGNSSTAQNIVVYEFEVYGVLKEVDESENIALNKPAEASSEYSNGQFVFEAKYAFDGSVEDRQNTFQSRWVSTRDESHDEWILVDLEDIYVIDSIVLNWEGAGAKEYKLLVSEDKENWTEVYHGTNGVGGIEEITFDTLIEARYVKMQGIEVGSKWGYSLWEFEVYAKEEVLENVALNKDSRASSEYTNPKSGFTLESKYAFDGSRESNGDTFQSRWVSARESNDEWIYVNLDGIYDISSVVLDWEGAYAKEYKIQVSTDAYTWEDVAHKTKTVAGIDEIIFDTPVYGQYVKMQGIEPVGEFGYSLWEFEVYGKKIGNFYVDKTLLEETIVENTGLLASAYTKDSYAVYVDALQAANTASTSDTATQDEVNECIDALLAAVTGLDERDTDALEDAIALAQSKVEAAYTEESYNAMKVVLEEALELLADGANTNTEYSDMADRLSTAITNLVERPEPPELTAQDIADQIIDVTTVGDSVVIPQYEGFTITIYSSTDPSVIDLDGNIYPKNDTCIIGLVFQVTKDDVTDLLPDTALTEQINIEVLGRQETIDYSGLEDMITIANGRVETDYTASSYQAMMAVYDQANALIIDGATTNQEVEDMRQALSDAIQGLVSIVDLRDAIAKANAIDDSLYTTESLNKVTIALEVAEAILGKSDASKAEVAQATNALNSAVSGLVKRGDNSQLKDLYDKLKDVDTSNYDASSVEKWKSVLAQIELLLNNPEATQEQLDALYKSLSEAYQEMTGDNTLIPEIPTTNGNGSDNGNSGQVKTGDTTTIIGYMFLGVVAGYMVLRKKRVPHN